MSGLATSSDGRLFANNDERAVIYEIAPGNGRVVKYFTLGSPPVRGDFEGLAVVDSDFFLVTSTGLLYQAREGRHEEHVQYTVQSTGLGSVCEIEGLAYEPADRSLLLACKRTQGKALGNAVTIFRWSIDGERLATPRVLSIPLAHFSGELHSGELHPSALERDPTSGHYFLVAARQRVVAEVTPNGAVMAVRRLPGGAHAQPEGIALSPDRTLIVSDEGAGGRATLTLYPYVR